MTSPRPINRKRKQEFSVFNSIPDSHLQSPIRPHERSFFVADPSTPTPRRYKQLRQACPRPVELLRIDSERIYGVLLRDVYSMEASRTKEWVKTHVPQCISAASDVIKKIYKALGLGEIHDPIITPDILYWYSIICQWEDIRNAMQALSNNHTDWATLSKPPFPCTSAWYCGSFIIFLIDDIYWLLSYDQVMMIADTALARCNTLVLHSLRPDDLPGNLDVSEITILYRIFDKEFEHLGNSVYAQIKNWEAVVSGLLIKQNDPFPGGKDFLVKLMEDAKINHHLLTEELMHTLSTMELDMHQLAEVYGMFRHFGHPTVDEDAGCRKVASIAKTRPIVSQQIMQSITGCIIRQFCSSFITKHGRWPNTSNLETISSSLLRHVIEKNITYINLYTANITVAEWAEITFAKELEIDYFIDYTQLLDDKSLSPELQDLPSIYDKDLLRYRPKQPLTSRRLLQRVMDIDQISIEEICNMIRNRTIPSKWFIVILHAKERELKTDPRLFAMMVLEMRFYFCTTEKNITKKVFSYFPQQTMTMTEAERDNRLLNFTVSQGGMGENYIHLLKSIDFKSWNLHWSELSTLQVCNFLDQVFGTPNLFNFGHEFFSRSVIALASPLNPPSGMESISDPTQIPESDRLWRNHQGGFEGIMQKLWTLITIGILLLVEEKTGIRSQIVGQGDNQVCRIAVPKTRPELSREDYIRIFIDDIKKFSDLFDSTLDDICQKIGLVVKTDESLTSSNVLIYGKDIIVDGVYLAQTTKRASRIMPDTNDMYPTLSESVATTQTAGMSTAQKSHEAVTPFVMGATSSLLLITRSAQSPLLPGVSSLDKKTQDVLLTLRAKELLLRSDPNFGGLPFLNPLEFLYRGHPDPLTSYTTFLALLIQQGDELAKQIWNYLETSSFEIGDGDSRLLIENPTSLNIRKPALLTSGFRAQLERFIESYPKNVALKTMMASSSRAQEKELYACLLQHRPLHLRFFHEVSALTIFGARRNFVGTFSSTRTTKKLLIGKASRRARVDEFVDDSLYDTQDAQELARMIKKTDFDILNFLKALILQILRSPHTTNNDCPTLLARQLRQVTWAPLIGNSPLEGITIPHPCHQFLVTFNAHPSHNYCSSNKEYILFKKDPSIKDPRIERGSYPHYVGSKTREKVTGKMLQLPTGSRSLEAAKRASQLRTWCVIPGSSMDLLLDKIISTRTNIPHDVLTMASGVISGGSLTHRLRDNITKHETLGGCPPNVTSGYYLSTDTLGRFSRGQDNYNMHFQGAVHLGYSCAQIKTTIDNSAPLTMHLHYNPCECEERIDDMYIGGDIAVPSLKTITSNPLIYCTVLDIEIGEVANMSGVQLVLHGSADRAAATVLLDRIRFKSSTAIWGISETVRPSVSTLGVKEISRLGIHSILRELAMLMILYYDLEPFQQSFFLTTLPPSVWSDIVAICLFPGVYKELMTAANIEGVSDAYYNNNSISSAILRVLRMEIIKLTRAPSSEKLANRTFFLTKNLGFSHVVQAWARFVYLRSGKSIDIRSSVRLGLNNYHKTRQDSGYDTGLMAHVLQSCDHQCGPGTALHVLANYPLKICRSPPETFFGDHLPAKTISQRNIPYFIASELNPTDDNYLCRLTLTRPLGEVRWESVSFAPLLAPQDLKKREDHMYRIVGQLSTAWAKILEILIREDITECKSAICLAEGEGSIHKAISNKYHCKTIYNNLINVDKLVSHRGVDYRPGCYTENIEDTYGSNISVQTGGDITNMETISSIIDAAAQAGMTPCGLITCDAEAAGVFSPRLVSAITNATLLIATKTLAHITILKVFTHDPAIVAYQLKTLHTVYTSAKMVVPLFSSHEGNEAYLVGKNLRSSSLTLSNLSPIDPRYAVTSDVHYLSNAVRELNLRRAAISSAPYQEQRWGCAKRLLNIGLTLGFKRNGNTSYERLIERIQIIHQYDRDTPRLIEMYIRKCIIMYFVSIKGLEAGRGMPPEWAMGLTRTMSIKTELERYATAYVNNEIIKFAIETPKTRDQVIGGIRQILSTGYTIRSLSGEMLYNIQPQDQDIWIKKNIKMLWRVYGSLFLNLD